MNECIFCLEQDLPIVEENELALAFRDRFPVTEGHTLIIPKRHAVTYFELTEAEVLAVNTLLHSQKSQIQAEDSSVVAFNIGINAGEAAGQTVFHCHIHLIPRRDGDVENPRGGIRHTIPGKGFY